MLFSVGTRLAMRAWQANDWLQTLSLPLSLSASSPGGLRVLFSFSRFSSALLKGAETKSRLLK